MCAARKGGCCPTMVVTIFCMLVSASSADRKGAMAVSGPDSPNATMSIGWDAARPVMTVIKRASTSPAASCFLAVAEATIRELCASSAPDIFRAARSAFTWEMYCGGAVRCDRPDLNLLVSGAEAREESWSVTGKPVADLLPENGRGHDDGRAERAGHTRLEYEHLVSGDTAGLQCLAHHGIAGYDGARADLSSDPGRRITTDRGGISRTHVSGAAPAGGSPAGGAPPGTAPPGVVGQDEAQRQGTDDHGHGNETDYPVVPAGPRLPFEGLSRPRPGALAPVCRRGSGASRFGLRRRLERLGLERLGLGRCLERSGLERSGLERSGLGPDLERSGFGRRSGQAGLGWRLGGSRWNRNLVSRGVHRGSANRRSNDGDGLRRCIPWKRDSVGRPGGLSPQALLRRLWFPSLSPGPRPGDGADAGCCSSLSASASARAAARTRCQERLRQHRPRYPRRRPRPVTRTPYPLRQAVRPGRWRLGPGVCGDANSVAEDAGLVTNVSKGDAGCSPRCASAWAWARPGPQHARVPGMMRAAPAAPLAQAAAAHHSHPVLAAAGPPVPRATLTPHCAAQVRRPSRPDHPRTKTRPGP